MSDIFREVDEALQQEKLTKIWKEYGSTIIAALVIVVLSTAATTAYHNWDSKRDKAETARLMKAIESDTPIQSLQNIVEDTRKNHAALGEMTAAGILIEENKKDEAAALYKKISENKKTPRDLRDLARLLYTQNAENKTITLLAPLLANEKSPWVWHARIEAAVITAHQSKDYAKALTFLSPFETATTIPLSLKQRAQALSHVYRLKQPKVTASAEKE